MPGRVTKRREGSKKERKKERKEGRKEERSRPALVLQNFTCSVMQEARISDIWRLLEGTWGGSNESGAIVSCMAFVAPRCPT